jgi:hypothetical protein
MAPLSPLRRHMIEDMTVRNLSPATQRSYLNAVSKFSRYFGRSPDQLGLEDVHAFQVHLVATGISWPALNQIVCALRFFYGVTLGHSTIPERIAGCDWRSFHPADRTSWVRLWRWRTYSAATALQAYAGHLGRVERRVMGAITACRTAVLGGHVEQCDDCGATRIAYNSRLMGKSINGELAAT